MQDDGLIGFKVRFKRFLQCLQFINQGQCFQTQRTIGFKPIVVVEVVRIDVDAVVPSPVGTILRSFVAFYLMRRSFRHIYIPI